MKVWYQEVYQGRLDPEDIVTKGIHSGESGRDSREGGDFDVSGGECSVCWEGVGGRVVGGL